ncbi:hypothetical protein An15g05390 [Aspergillus niger]|uniref:Uncharacterized protein n=1 Tax=Aspergillus niger TaxID=5061 RepID=A0A124BWW1_ASPNG|nr:hypothetical protein An15g05390 [Aspergillus niger]
MAEPGAEQTPYPEPGEPPVPDKALQLQILLILCLSVYIITAICLLLKSYCIAYGTLDFTSTPATTPDHTAAWNSLQRLKSLNRVAPLKRYDSWWKILLKLYRKTKLEIVHFLQRTAPYSLRDQCSLPDLLTVGQWLPPFLSSPSSP